MNKTKKPKIVIAMSGGVDSSVAAIILRKAGFEVTGVFLRLYDSPRFKEGEKRTKKIAKILKIPIRVLDLRKEFKKAVIGHFLKEYKAGRTPNPCVVCNKEIKFGLLLKKALEMGADYLATGHYALARVVPKREIKNFTPLDMKLSNRVEIKNYELLRGRDKNKDQSYFLWKLNQNQLKRILFPVGGYTKTQVKKLAKKFKLPVFEALESQEICFIQAETKDFLKKHIKQKPGRIVDSSGKIIGQHRGLAFYTIGQRKEIGLPGGPFWVFAKDLERNILIVTRKEKDLYKKELICQDVSWVSGKEPKLPLKIKAKIRYRSTPTPAVIKKCKPKAKVCSLMFDRPQRAITLGQSVVFYQGNQILGGGIIKEVVFDWNK